MTVPIVVLLTAMPCAVGATRRADRSRQPQRSQMSMWPSVGMGVYAPTVAMRKLLDARHSRKGMRELSGQLYLAVYA
jgi:hypothetical protein